MSDFSFACWVATALTSLLILAEILLRRFQFVRPSFVFLLFFHVQVQWTSTVYAADIQQSLPRPWDYFILSQIFPLLSVALASLTFRERSKRAYERIIATQPVEFSEYKELLLLGFLIVFLTIAYYFFYVPYSETGLYAIFFNPSNATELRERSMKLLDDAALKYIYSLVCSSVVPILASMLFLTGFQFFKGFKVKQFLLCIALLGVLILSVSIYGARAPSALLFLTGFYSIYLKKGLPIKTGGLLAAIGVGLFFPTIFSLFRQGEELTLERFTYFYVDILDRVFWRAIQDGIWHAEYVQKNGYFGVAGIGNFAHLFGIEPRNIYNIVGKAYSSSGLESTSANASFVVSYYACFGNWVVLPCIALTLLLDVVLFVCPHLVDEMQIPFLAAIGISATYLTSTFYTTALVTFGLAIIPFVSLLFSNIPKVNWNPRSQKDTN